MSDIQKHYVKGKIFNRTKQKLSYYFIITLVNTN